MPSDRELLANSQIETPTGSALGLDHAQNRPALSALNERFRAAAET
jgi:hypothetical protein